MNKLIDDVNSIDISVYASDLDVIEKNTSNDCKALNEIRQFYNEKCKNTALINSDKEMSTFASSELSGNFNNKMLKRLNFK